MEQKDVCELARLYSEISINKNNYHDKLNPISYDSFSRTGGMFLIHDEKSIISELNSNEAMFGIAEDENGQILASFWCSLHDENLEPVATHILPEKRMIYPRELIVNPACKVPKISCLMFYTLFLYFYNHGYDCSLGEVYKVLKYNDNNGAHNVDMLNKRSFNMTEYSGGVHLGQMPSRSIKMDSFTVEIEPQLFLFDYEPLLAAQKEKFLSHGITVLIEEGSYDKEQTN